MQGPPQPDHKAPASKVEWKPYWNLEGRILEINSLKKA